jgi:hypothetical protein
VQGAVHTGASRGRAASTTTTSTGVALTRDRPRQQGLSCRRRFRVSAPQALAGALRVCRRAAQRAPWGPFAPSRPPPECRVRRSRGATFAEHGTNPPETTDYFNKWNNASATLAMAANGMADGMIAAAGRSRARRQSRLGWPSCNAPPLHPTLAITRTNSPRSRDQLRSSQESPSGPGARTVHTYEIRSRARLTRAGQPGSMAYRSVTIRMEPRSCVDHWWLKRLCHGVLTRVRGLARPARSVQRTD